MVLIDNNGNLLNDKNISSYNINSIDLTMLTDDNINSQIIFGKINGFSHVYQKGSLKRIINVSLKLPEDTKEVLQEFIQKTRVRRKK